MHPLMLKVLQMPGPLYDSDRSSLPGDGACQPASSAPSTLGSATLSKHPPKAPNPDPHASSLLLRVLQMPGPPVQLGPRGSPPA